MASSGRLVYADLVPSAVGEKTCCVVVAAAAARVGTVEWAETIASGLAYRLVVLGDWRLG